jgi:hypothetical protein
MNWRRRLADWVTPGVITIRRYPAPTAPDAVSTTNRYEMALQAMSHPRRTLAEGHAVVAYQSQQARRQAIEMKAAAALTVAGLIATGAAIIVTLGAGISRVVVLISVGYLTSGAFNATRVLVPRPTATFTPQSVIDDTPSADLLAATELEQSPTLRASNQATVAIRDFACAGALLVLALVVAVIRPDTPQQSGCVKIVHDRQPGGSQPMLGARPPITSPARPCPPASR